MMRRTCVVLGLVAILASSTASAVSGQTILGRVLDQVNEAPVAGAIVSLITRDGTERVKVLADSLGRFVLTPPEAGEYVLAASRFGYMDTTSPLLSLGVEGQAPLELMLSPEPFGLEGIEVSVEERASEELQSMGLSPNQLGNRWIDRKRIEEIPIKIDIGAILERTAQSNILIIRPANLAPGSDDMGLCVSLYRTRSMGRGHCALVVLDGIPISGVQALDIDPDAVESIAVLEPMQSTTFYGTIGGSGAVLVWTRRGG
ncbi:MAG: carboxypeptidase-like regulatory domain-containing protein [Gemmatimonadetes bacterium]|nr:carboxypeptidase-like regulatory domain-containing protein [Gemmatimonadota bacterium]MDA1103321.1 carboxypeptidase-like regulatory domain-containing protein [Gemmatimonadota bacterium]